MSLKSLSDVMVKIGSTASKRLTKNCVCVNDCEKSGNSVNILPLTLLVCTFLEFESNLGSFSVSEGDCYAEAKLTMQMRYPILNMYILRNVVNVNYIFKRAVAFSTLDGCLSSEAQSPISLEEDVLNTFRYAQSQMREQIGVGLRVLSDTQAQLSIPSNLPFGIRARRVQGIHTNSRTPACLCYDRLFDNLENSFLPPFEKE